MMPQKLLQGRRQVGLVIREDAEMMNHVTKPYFRT